GLDASRAASALGGDPAKRMSAAALLLTLPGSPFLLSGEEVGPAGGAQDSILGAYRQLIRARHHSNSLRYGALEALRPPHQSASILSFVRRYAGSRVLVVHNLSAAALEAGPFFIKGKLVPLYSSRRTRLPHRSVPVLSLDTLPWTLRISSPAPSTDSSGSSRRICSFI